MLKFTRNSVIAFDFKEALSFEGETGPYVQYAVVRARNIFRKAGTTPEAALAEVNAADYFEGEGAAGLWELWIMASRLSLLLEQCIAAAEPAYLAKHAFQLAQLFNNFYHRHHILTEEDPARRQFLLGHRRGCRTRFGPLAGVVGNRCPGCHVVRYPQITLRPLYFLKRRSDPMSGISSASAVAISMRSKGSR